MLSACHECGQHFPRKADESWKRLCLPCWRKSKGISAAATAPASPALDPTRIRQLLQLTHPDRHGGSSLANEVTAWLLDLRRALR
jgi:hypothetical protein